MKPKRVAIIGTNWPEYELHCPNWNGMMSGLQDLKIDYRFFTCRPALDVYDVIKYEPDLVIYGLLDMVRSTNWRTMIREGLPNAKIVMWYGDLRNERTGQIEADMSEIDAMFVSNNAQAEYYEKIWRVPKCHFLPLGSPVYKPEIKPQYKNDFIFVGAIDTQGVFNERASIILGLKQQGLKVINAPASTQPALRTKILRDLPSLYRTAKISLDWSHFTAIDGYTSNRFWIITGAGGFALTKRFPGCTDFYPEGTRAYFDTPQEAVKLKEHYLANPKEREAIRRAGYRHAKLHTYRYRFGTMFDILYAKELSESEDGLRQPGL